MEYLLDQEINPVDPVDKVPVTYPHDFIITQCEDKYMYTFTLDGHILYPYKKTPTLMLPGYERSHLTPRHWTVSLSYVKGEIDSTKHESYYHWFLFDIARFLQELEELTNGEATTPVQS